MSSGASASALQRLVEQLKLEAGVERIKVSQAAAELQQYCTQNACKDALLVGVPAGSNPFREPRSCALLGRSSLRNAFKYKVMNDCLQVSRKHFPQPMTFRYFSPFRWPGPIAKIPQELMSFYYK
ncbi:guanine nucleotide-binding protein G(I)/G(S)/G(O) subunit gamma-10 isoform X1 [Nycticebus coucang]|uniref:guanine nucleotide-binding protein G(I)/G(S)/G(O) subunit gamma-10 isoform X1 n=2 Tax=Nycticebus coucang TaxID=9470 RepID=UPI00234DB54F|nr:guanine nucleotide-binding protein G(I)/G(S)/G(O) subunit gamma-10 isoform X1 [Nycticebus coucang]